MKKKTEKTSSDYLKNELESLRSMIGRGLFGKQNESGKKLKEEKVSKKSGETEKNSS